MSNSNIPTRRRNPSIGWRMAGLAATLLLGLFLLPFLGGGSAEAACPYGTYPGPYGTCIGNPQPRIVVPSCGPNRHWENGHCVWNACPPGLIRAPNGVCIPPFVPTCGPNKHWESGRCVWDACPPGLVRTPRGNCIPIACPPQQHWEDGRCTWNSCPPGLTRINGVCVPLQPSCGPGYRWRNGYCVPIY